MHFNLRFFLYLFSVLLVGCSISPNELKTAERMMETSPDSALQVLQQIHSVNNLSDADRALYGLLYFEALDKANKPLKPDSLLNFSLDYYQKKHDDDRLAECLYYKGLLLKQMQNYDNATVLYLKGLDLLGNTEKYSLLGRIYSDLGDICSVQMDYNEAFRKYKKSIDFFRLAGNLVEANYRYIYIGRLYRFQKNYKRAHLYYTIGLKGTLDPYLMGSAYQEIGINYYNAKSYDSAKIFLRKSLVLPFKSTSYSVRCINLAELFFEQSQFDSAFYYALTALKYPSNFYNQRDCYRVLANVEFKRQNLKKMAHYIAKYQDCSDSLRRIEMQTKTSVLEGMHLTSQAASESKHYLTILGCTVPVILLASLFVVVRLRNRNKGKDKQLEEAEVQISQKQYLLIESLLLKIQEMKNAQAQIYKKGTPAQREQMDKELYSACLHVNDWPVFKKLMNSVLNNIIEELEDKYPDITQKELTWSCLFLLDIPTPDIALILESQPSSLYKLKQRLTKKMNLKSTKDLDVLLSSFLSGK